MMRRSRITFWIISIVICGIVIKIYSAKQGSVPYEKREPVNVYCIEEFQDEIKETIEEDKSFGKTHRVVFTDDKKSADFILSDEIFSSEKKEYEVAGYTPLVAVYDNDKKEQYKEEEYINKKTEELKFNRILVDIISGKFKDNVYYPNLNTAEGKMFNNFLLINFNKGLYPRNEDELQRATKKAEKFFSAENTIEMISLDRVKNKEEVVDEIYITFEKDVAKELDGSGYAVGYPTNTVVYKYYYNCKNESIQKIMEKKSFLYNFKTKIQSIMGEGGFREEFSRARPSVNHVSLKSDFSSVDIPLKDFDE